MAHHTTQERTWLALSARVSIAPIISLTTLGTVVTARIGPAQTS